MTTILVEPRLVVHTESTGVDTLEGTSRDGVNAVRFLSADMVEEAGSGHPGTPMALAPLAYRPYTKWLRYDPETPDWFAGVDIDRLAARLQTEGTAAFTTAWNDLLVSIQRNSRPSRQGETAPWK
jgi:hypothetical protein